MSTTDGHFCPYNNITNNLINIHNKKVLKINKKNMGYAPKGGEVIKSDGQTVNEADLMTTDTLTFGRVTLTAVAQMPNIPCEGVTIKNLNASAGLIYIGSDDSVDDSNGFELGVGESIYLELTGNLNELYAYPGASGAELCFVVSK